MRGRVSTSCERTQLPSEESVESCAGIEARRGDVCKRCAQTCATRERTHVRESLLRSLAPCNVSRIAMGAPFVRIVPAGAGGTRLDVFLAEQPEVDGRALAKRLIER